MKNAVNERGDRLARKRLFDDSQLLFRVSQATLLLLHGVEVFSGVGTGQNAITALQKESFILNALGDFRRAGLAEHASQFGLVRLGRHFQHSACRLARGVGHRGIADVPYDPGAESLQLGWCVVFDALGEVLNADVSAHQFAGRLPRFLQPRRFAACVKGGLVIGPPGRVWICQRGPKVVQRPLGRALLVSQLKAARDLVAIIVNHILEAALDVVPRFQRRIVDLDLLLHPHGHRSA